MSLEHTGNDGISITVLLVDLIIELQYNVTHTASENNSHNPIVKVHSQIYYHLYYGRGCMSANADAYIAL